MLRTAPDHFGLRCPESDYLCTYHVAERIWPDLPDHQLGSLAAPNPTPKPPVECCWR
ncbi:MAG: hypothetical protein ACLQVY_00120 [Limisphaerales bacterium]